MKTFSAKIVYASITLLITSLLFLKCGTEQNAQTTDNKILKDTIKNQYDPQIPDDYFALKDFSNYKKWTTYNVHDPCGIKANGYYYVYCTDVMMGYRKLPRVGIPIRRSKDLVHFEFIGWAFDTIPRDAIDYVKKANKGREPENIWAPYILKYNDIFRLYYSVSVFGSDASYIGMAESKSPEGQWIQKGSVVTSGKNGGRNAIDPTVVTDHKSGNQWMAYGSCFGGIFMLQINPKTGLALVPGDKGELIASRDGISSDGCGKGEGGIDGVKNIEGVDIIYHPGLQKYFLFISYDWLGNNYNVRVGRSEKPQGPYNDYFGKDFQQPDNHLPMIVHPYLFNNHPGWAGTGHCGILEDGNKFFMLHQGRLRPTNFPMNLHVREILWTLDGWPVVSPERYAIVPDSAIIPDNIPGRWEQITLNNKHLDINHSEIIEFLNDKTMKGVPGSNWKLDSDNLQIMYGKEQSVLNVKVFNAWDWENKKITIVYTGINADGFGVWGKKI